MRTVRNIAIIALLALVVAVVPGGGNAAEAVLTAITLAFMAVIAFAAYSIYRQNQLTFISLSERQRGLLLGALGVIALMIAGADELLATGLGALVWIGLMAAAVIAIWRVWVESQSY